MEPRIHRFINYLVDGELRGLHIAYVKIDNADRVMRAEMKKRNATADSYGRIAGVRYYYIDAYKQEDE